MGALVWGLMFSPAVSVFFFVSVFGTVLVLLSGGLIGMWIGLELGLFGFIPILNGKTVGENEGAVKYFIVQAVGSGMMLMSFLVVGGCIDLSVGSLYFEKIADWGMLMGFMVKLGVFPLHFWFPSVMSFSSWFSCFWLSVTQKLGPFWGLSGLGLSCDIFNVLILFLVGTSLVGAFGGLAQVQFRALLAYSSLGQTGWMGLVCMLQVELFVMYMMLYAVILGGLLWALYLMKSYSYTEMPGWSFNGGLLFWVMSGGFFISLSGLPPLAGSALKLMGVLLIVDKFPFLLAVLIFSSMVSLYYYLSVFINSMVCLGSGGFETLYEISENAKVMAIVATMMVLNWVIGFPLFLVCGVVLL